ncbi:MAG: hypothetical protein QOD84_2609, partial [Acidobacteriaceae bacterium]
ASSDENGTHGYGIPASEADLSGATEAGAADLDE